MQLLETLYSIASNIQIEPAVFFVGHHNYEGTVPKDNVIKQLQRLPQRIQEKYLNSHLQHLIYGIYFSGSLVKETTHVVKTDYNDEFVKITSEVDWNFYDELHKNNKGKGSFFPNCRVLKQETDSRLVVQMQDIILNIQRDCHLQLAERSAAVGDLVAVSMPPSQFKRGYYTAIGDAVFDLSAPVALVYFNFSPEGAVALMEGLTTRLNEIKIPFVFLVFYNPSSYGGYYSGFLRFHKDSYESVKQVLQTVYKSNQLYFQSQVPIFTKTLAPGLALTEDAEQKFQSFENLGLNRCTIVAKALLEAHKNGDKSPEARMKYILQYFDRFRIDLERPYLNPNSEDIYTPLD
jgi:hypothetical protein